MLVSVSYPFTMTFFFFLLSSSPLHPNYFLDLIIYRELNRDNFYPRGTYKGVWEAEMCKKTVQQCELPILVEMSRCAQIGDCYLTSGTTEGEANIAFITTDEEIAPETLDSWPRSRKLGFLASESRDFCTMTHNLPKGRNINQR